MKTKLPGALLSTLLFYSQIPALALDQEDPCVLPPYLLATNTDLPLVSEAVVTDQPVHVLLVGSSSMSGVATSSPARSLPEQFAQALKKRMPAIKLRISTITSRGQTLAQSVARIQHQIDSLQPTLVVWQIGLNDVAGRMPAFRFNALLEEGIAAVQGTGSADLILMDIPYYREAGLLMQASEYRKLIAFRADYEHIPMMPVYRMMQYWDDRQTFKPSGKTPRPQARQIHLADQIHQCLGTALAAQVIRGIKPPQ